MVNRIIKRISKEDIKLVVQIILTGIGLAFAYELTIYAIAWIFG